MSEAAVTVLDWNRAIFGKMHGSDTDRAIAALAAEPETIEELDVAMRRFTSIFDRSHFAHFHRGDSDQPWDAGVVIIDLAARLIAGESTYSGIATQGSVDGPTRDESVNFQLSRDWEVSHGIECWRGVAERRREERASHTRIDARQVLFGRPMIEFIVSNIVEKRNLEPSEAVNRIHADWLMTSRSDLSNKNPREVLLERHDFIGMDLQYREFQWSSSGKCPPGLDRDSAAYRFAGFGTSEIVLYYDLVRNLLWECRARCDQESGFNRLDEMLRLEKLRDAWLELPDPEFHGRTPASIIDKERRRLPEGVIGAEAAVDPDCPCCQMMIEDIGPYFWHLDGCNMDDEFAFSFYRTREEWDEEQRRHEEFNREFEAKQARRQLDQGSAANIWSRTFTNEEFLDDMPLSQLVPIALFGFAAMVSELNQDLRVLGINERIASAHQETLNRLLGNVRAALNESAELIDPALHRLVSELEDLAERYPTISAKCSDLSRRLREFPSKLTASVEREDLPF